MLLTWRREVSTPWWSWSRSSPGARQLFVYIGEVPEASAIQALYLARRNALTLSGVSEQKELDPSTQFRQLYDQEYRSVYRSIRAVVLDSAAAEDLTQETFVRAYRARDRYTPTAPPGAWLRRIGINLAISYLRRQKLARFLPARLYIAPDRRDYDRAEARDVVSKALTGLSPKLRAAVILHYYDGLTREEIAQVLGVPAGTVASRIAKAVAIMRKAIGNDQDWEPKRSSSEGALRGR